MMDSGLKQLWVDALRSGKYKQGAGYLRTPGDTFCCLGVLADVIDPEGWSGIELSVWRDSACFLPPSDPLELRVQDKLTKMNDSGKSFEDIATYIEENL